MSHIVSSKTRQRTASKDFQAECFKINRNLPRCSKVTWEVTLTFAPDYR